MDLMDGEWNDNTFSLKRIFSQGGEQILGWKEDMEVTIDMETV